LNKTKTVRHLADGSDLMPLKPPPQGIMSEANNPGKTYVHQIVSDLMPLKPPPQGIMSEANNPGKT